MMKNICCVMLLAMSCGLSFAQPLDASEARNLMSEDDMNTLKESNMIKKSAQLQMQFVSPDDETFTVDGVEYDCSKLKPWSNLQQGGNVVIVDNEPFDARGHLISRGTVNGADVMLVKNDSGRITYVSVFKGDKHTTLIPSGVENILMTVNDGDYDTKRLSEFILNDDALEQDGFHETTLKQAGRVRGGGGDRTLQECDDGKEREIEIAIGFDSSFCSKYGGSSAAVQYVETILVEAGRYYEMLNISLKISKIEGFCSSSNDVYQKEFNRISASSCGDGLTAMRNLWQYSNSPFRNVNRDVAHVFIGQALPSMGSVIGCAYVGALCGSVAYGLNEIGFTESLQSQVYLFTHELGHNAGASHSSQGYIMNPSVGGTGPQWAVSSERSIKNHVCNQSCLAKAEDPTTAPPTTAPPTTSPPTDVPDAFLLKSASKKSHCIRTQKGNVLFARCKNGNGAFHWKMDKNGRLKNVNAKGLCLKSPQKTNKYLKLATCANEALQKWTLNGDGSLRSKANNERCVRFEGQKLQLIRCKKSPPKGAEWKMKNIV